MSKIKIAIIEDLKDVSYTLRDIINEQQDMECTRLYHTAEDAMIFLKQNIVDIIIVDIGLPRASGIEAILYLSTYCPHTTFCMFTVYDDDEKIFQSLQAGAKGYILKNTSNEKLIESIRELYAGGSPMSPTIARRLINVFRSNQVSTKSNQLPVSDRELELLTLLAKGLLYKEIADQLGIAVGTVKQHIHRIYDRLHVTNRTEAINLYNNRKDNLS
jgi:DNA-binding NarL/FixJ family response regulator